jgi:hypothetical protein
MVDRGNEDAFGEVGKWIAYVLPAFLIWLAGVWAVFLFAVPAQLAHENEQAHFGHEFRAFTGLTPTRYVEVRRQFLREHPGHVLDSWPLPAN